MEMVSSVKMQKAIKTVEAGRDYIQNAWNILVMLSKITSSENHPLLKKRPVKKIGVIVVSSDRGLCGNFNYGIVQKTSQFSKENENIEFVSVGSKGANPIRKITGGELIAEFGSFGNEIEFGEITPVAKLVLDGYKEEKYDKIVAIYSHFESSLKQTPVVKQILPITEEHIDIPELWQPLEEKSDKTDYKFEPSPDEILESVLEQYIRVQIYGAILESNASEHSARMVAMKNASDNARDIIGDLTLTYNSIRQGSITNEIAEICSAAEAMK